MLETLGWLAMIFGWVALYLCGKYRFGWLLGALVWVLWFPYGLMLGSVPIMLNTTVYALVSLVNWKNWSRDAVDK